MCISFSSAIEVKCHILYTDIFGQVSVEQIFKSGWDRNSLTFERRVNIVTLYKQYIQIYKKKAIRSFLAEERKKEMAKKGTVDMIQRFPFISPCFFIFSGSTISAFTSDAHPYIITSRRSLKQDPDDHTVGFIGGYILGVGAGVNELLIHRRIEKNSLNIQRRRDSQLFILLVSCIQSYLIVGDCVECMIFAGIYEEHTGPCSTVVDFLRGLHPSHANTYSTRGLGDKEKNMHMYMQILILTILTETIYMPLKRHYPSRGTVSKNCKAGLLRDTK